MKMMVMVHINTFVLVELGVVAEDLNCANQNVRQSTKKTNSIFLAGHVSFYSTH